MLTPESVIDRLCGTFHPVFAKWQEWRPHELHLWDVCAGLTEASLLERDVHAIGVHFASADNIGARSEYALTAECIAWVRVRNNLIPATRTFIEAETDRVYKNITSGRDHEVKPPIRQDSPFHAPVSWRVAQAVVGAGRGSQASLEGLLEAYTDLAHLFVLCDGNITSEEDIQLMRFHAAFDG